MLKIRVLIVTLLATATVCTAQDRGTVRGTVTDQSGAAVPSGLVTVRNVRTGLTQTTRTETDGIYSFLYLPAGEYTITVEKAGFRKAETSGVGVHVATVTNVDVQMTLGAVEQTVEVTAATPLLDVQGSNLGKVIPS